MIEFMLGIFVGALLFYVFKTRTKYSGTFYIDFSDPMKDVCKLELDENINDIYTRSKMVLRVKAADAPSQD